jgi:hypothetical protein
LEEYPLYGIEFFDFVKDFLFGFYPVIFVAVENIFCVFNNSVTFDTFYATESYFN